MRDQKKLIRRLIARVLILAVTATLTAFSVAAQNTNITLPSSKLSAREVFDNIKRQTSYMVVVNNNLTDNLSVTISRSPVTVKAALDRLLAGSGLNYRTDGNYIIISQMTAAQTASVVAVNTVRNVAGTVTDGENTLEGVTVQMLDFAGKEAVTNVQGRFLVEGIAPGRQVVKLISADGQSIRFREITVPASKDADVNLVMGGELMAMGAMADSAVSVPVSPTATKTTAYFVPNTQDNTIRAFSDEPKTSYSFVPEQSITGNSQYLPKFGIKTNLLYWIPTTPNIGLEFGMARKWTMDISAGYNPFQWHKGGVNKWGYVQPEARYWFCQRFEKHFIGLHALYIKYNIGNTEFPFTDAFEQYRYDGWGAGAGISYGYHLPMAKRWAWEFSVGAGYVYLEYDKYRCYDCDEYEGRKNRHYFGPTKAGVSLIYMIR